MFICLFCSSPLTQKENSLLCSRCGKKWEFVNGIAKFGEHTEPWSLLSEEEERDLLTHAESIGWAEAIKTSTFPDVRSLYEWADCPTRADATFYLPLNEKSHVLDLGSGWGSFTFALAPRVRQVVAADVNLQSLKLIRLRAIQDKIENVTPVLIAPLDFGKLPFADSSFDAVIMNGVLEWVGSHSKIGDPLRKQKNALSEVKRILKKGGGVLIGIENRFGLKYFFGAPDDHLRYYSSKNISYTMLLPRIIASWITKRQIGIPYRTYTHSLNGYRFLLKRAGYREIEFYFPDPDYRAVTTQIYPLKTKELKKVLWSKIRCGLDTLTGGKYKYIVLKAFFELIKFLKLESHICDCYLIIGIKE